MREVVREREVELTLDAVHLPGTLAIPEAPKGAVIFAHGSGSSRHSPRNVQVARSLNGQGFATLLFDLLDDGEARDRRNVFDIPLLAERLLGATRWLRERPEAGDAPAAYFGASTGAAAALWAAGELGDDVGAVVSRGGRPDLARPLLGSVVAPTQLIVGALDVSVLELNREAERLLRCEKELVVVPDAGHLFEEPGALEAVSTHAGDWFGRHLGT